ncbi:uncharacterized protein LOC143543250 [Bidens hawaiensis]|uniref:uncharacterized protein LOC143543250 n=1 Tax=Bidens hawaiensis TaxID=980011 RepID=UPI00404999DD
MGDKVDLDNSDDNKSSESDTWDFIDGDTQIFDSPTSSFGNIYDGDAQSTIPFDDTVVCEDELATQVMDSDDETQAVNLGGETQVMNLDTECEEVDVFDETQLFNDYDTEDVVSDYDESEKTEIVDDSDEDSLKPKTDCGRSEQRASGVGFKKFTSIRAASMRAAGLAALNKASKLSKSPSRPSLNSGPDTEHRRILLGKCNSVDLEEVNKSTDGQKTGSKFRKTARKLFAEDPLLGGKDSDGNFDLGYIDSQVPGDASEANALDFVDNFLKINIECDDSCGIRKSTGGKSKPVLSAKGAQIFAKSAGLIDGVDKRRIFDWDGKPEDNAESDFFAKHKESFFASGGRRRKSSISSGSRKLGRSDSKLVLGKNKENEKLNKRLETVKKLSTVRKNLIDELDEQATDMPDGKDVQETTEARFDAQIAAEPKKGVCLGLQAPGHVSTKTKGHHKSQPRSLTNNGVRITRSKMSGDQIKEVMQDKSAAKKSEDFAYEGTDVVKRTGKVSLKRRKVDSVEAPVTPVDQTPVKKQCIQYVTPVAQQTRNSMRSNQSEKVKRSRQKLPPTRKETSTQSISRLTRSKAATLTGQEKGLTTERIEKSPSVCPTPVNCPTPVKESSPICMGDGYLRQSCRSLGRSSCIQEVCSLFSTERLVKSPNRDTRQGKDASLIRVLFSRHLDENIIKNQKKILSRLGAAESTSMSDATHFIADDFVRTRNMLEAIAFGKPVVTHLWLESCGQACCHIDEKNFILRDVKKEKEFGFNLPASLARAHQNPLLKGYRVLITPNTKPGKEILSSLVKAVHGVAIERMGRSLWNNSDILEGLLILSCEEDYAVCIPFLEKGAAIYGSELLLNGIVTQRLEYERYRLFLDHMKRTRSTIWVNKDDKHKAVGRVK